MLDPDDLDIYPTALDQMRSIGGSWYAYRNAAFDSSRFGHLKFLKCGEGCTFSEPPKRLPDTPTEINWPYLLVAGGPLDLGRKG